MNQAQLFDQDVDALDQAKLKALLDYDPDTGLFTWKRRERSMFKSDRSFKTWNRKHAFKNAGYKDPNGYRVLKIDYRSYKAHRLAWLFMYGSFPPLCIDHINRNKFDNRIINLRAVSHQENFQNLPLLSTNRSGVMGVYWHKIVRRWYAQIGNPGRGTGKHLGSYDDWFEAVCARKSAEVAQGYHVNHGRKVA